MKKRVSRMRREGWMGLRKDFRDMMIERLDRKEDKSKEEERKD